MRILRLQFHHFFCVRQRQAVAVLVRINFAARVKRQRVFRIARQHFRNLLQRRSHVCRAALRLVRDSQPVARVQIRGLNRQRRCQVRDSRVIRLQLQVQIAQHRGRRRTFRMLALCLLENLGSRIKIVHRAKRLRQTHFRVQISRRNTQGFAIIRNRISETPRRRSPATLLYQCHRCLRRPRRAPRRLRLTRKRSSRDTNTHHHGES